MQWQELAVFTFKPDDVHRLSVKTDKETALVRGTDKQWSWAQPNKP